MTCMFLLIYTLTYIFMIFIQPKLQLGLYNYNCTIYVFQLQFPFYNCRKLTQLPVKICSFSAASKWISCRFTCVEYVWWVLENVHHFVVNNQAYVSHWQHPGRWSLVNRANNCPLLPVMGYAYESKTPPDCRELTKICRRRRRWPWYSSKIVWRGQWRIRGGNAALASHPVWL